MTERVEKYRGNITPEEIVKKIINSKSIVLTVHTSPDGDALGSVLAFFLMIEEYNKKYIKNISDFIKVKIVIDDKLPKYIGKFQENVFLEKYEEFSPNSEYDLFISLDCANEERYGRTVEFKKISKTSINIDHHVSNTEHADYNYVEDVCSTAELIYKFLEIFKIELNKKIAEYIYLGIINDTGNFRHDNVTEKTFEICSKLIKAGVNNHKIANILFSMSREKSDLFGDVYENKVIDDKYGFIYYYLPEEKIKKLNVSKDDTDGIAEFLLKIEGMELSLFLREEDGKRKGSLRCNDKYNVNEIASIFNGGGHIKAAGFKIDLPVEEIISKIYKKL